MKIALDYDRTYTADPVFWDRLVQLAREHGHEIQFVTYRYQDAMRYKGTPYPTTNDDIEWHATMLNMPIKYCNHTAKNKHFTADVWIDDKPETIIEDNV